MNTPEHARQHSHEPWSTNLTVPHVLLDECGEVRNAIPVEPAPRADWSDLDERIVEMRKIAEKPATESTTTLLGTVLGPEEIAAGWMDVADAVQLFSVPEVKDSLFHGPFSTRVVFAQSKVQRDGNPALWKQMPTVPTTPKEFRFWRHAAAMGSLVTTERAWKTGQPTPVAHALTICALAFAAPFVGAPSSFTFDDELDLADHPSTLPPSPLALVSFAEPIPVPPLNSSIPDTPSFVEGRESMFAAPLTPEGFYEHGGRVEGVLLVTDSWGDLTNTVLWVVRSNRDATGLTAMLSEQRRVMLGRLDRAELAPLVHTLARAIAAEECWEFVG